MLSRKIYIYIIQLCNDSGWKEQQHLCMQLTLKVYTPHAQTWSHVLISTENHLGSQRSNWSYIMGNEKLKNEQNASYCYWKARELFQDVRGLLLSGSVMSDFLWPPELQHARPSCPSPSPRVYSNSCPLSQWCLPTISSSSPPAFNLSQHQGLFQWVTSLHQVANLQHQSFQWISRAGFL